MMIRRIASLAVVFVIVVPLAHAQPAAWPIKPVRIVVPFTPGGTTDRIARLFAARLSKELGQQFIVDNRAGASGTIGSEIAARAAPDGYTLAVVPSSFAINAVLYKLPYHPVTGIEPVGMIVTGPLVLTVHASVSAATLKDFIALARAKPGALRYGSTGAGTNIHLAGALFQQMTRTELVHIPYKGQGPAVIDLLAGEIQLMFSGPGTMLPHIRAGRLRGLAVTATRRSPILPELPAVSELLPGYAADFWTAMWAPKGTPRAIVQRLNQEIVRFLEQPDVRRLQAEGIEPAHTTPEGLARVIQREIATWGKVVKAANMEMQ
jgi:tripartite-type tricarboxylate transporter receptor subunit TctC